MGQIVFRGILLAAAIVGGAVLLGGFVIAIMVALYLALAQVVSPAAALAAASVVPLVAGIIAITVVPRLMQAAPARRTPVDSEQALAELGNLAGTRLYALMGAHPQKTAMASLLAGFAVGASPDLRRALRNLLRP